MLQRADICRWELNALKGEGVRSFPSEVSDTIRKLQYPTVFCVRNVHSIVGADVNC